MKVIAEAIAKIGYGYSPQSTGRIGLWNQETSGRSGYWRLFYYQMQEEALKERDKLHRDLKEDLKKWSAKTRVEKDSPKKTFKPRVQKPSTEAIPSEPRIRLLPPRPDSTPLMARVWEITSEFRNLRSYSRDKISSSTSSTVKAISGDVVEDESILLLLAA